MENLKIAVAQFEPNSGDKDYNLKIIEELAREAKLCGADAVSFHELSVTGYTFLKNLNKKQLFEIAEEIPIGRSCMRLMKLAKKLQISILAGLPEREGNLVFNTYLFVDESGVSAKFRKLHPFINPHLSQGGEYVLFELKGWKCGMLICYDNNIIENVRATSLLGADLIFSPHVTGCTPSPMPGRGFVSDQIWQNRHSDPTALREEFDGPKGRGWLMRWLPARAYDNGIYIAFTNPIGYDGDQLKNGNSMILDPYGEVIAETRSFGSEISMAVLTPEKLRLAGGYRYKQARRPELYRDILGKSHPSTTKPFWMSDPETEPEGQ